MVNAILKEILVKVQDGASLRALCEYGDKRLNEETSKVYKKDKEMTKGIAFPTAVSVNNCVCHFSPLVSDDDLLLKKEDMVKIDIGAHVDGYVACAAHTVIVGASKDQPVTGRKADVMMAAHKALEVALRLVKPGNSNFTVTDGIQKVVEDFKCIPCEGMISHQFERNIVDGEKVFVQNPDESLRKDHETYTFEMHEVYGIDVLISSGDGKVRELGTRTTIYKKKDMVYQLKMKSSRQFLSEADTKFGLMPFNLRSFEDERRAKLGVVECVKHQIMEPYTVLWEKEGSFVAQFWQTVILMPNGTLKITGLPFEEELYKSEYSVVNPESVALLNTSMSKKSAKKKKKRAGKSLAENAMAVDEAED